MNMKNKSQGKNRGGTLRTLFAGLLLTVSTSGWAALPEQLELSPLDALELAAEETEAALRLADPSVANGRIELSTESWDSQVEPASNYRRPVEKGLVTVPALASFTSGWAAPIIRSKAPVASSSR